MGGPDEHEAPPEVVSSGAEVGLAEPALDRGQCPICDAEFDDRAAFREHLGEVHDLYDDEGAETDFLPPLLAPVEVRSLLSPPPAKTPDSNAPSAEATPPRGRRRSLGIAAAVLVLLLLVGIGGIVAASNTGDDGVRVASGEVTTTAGAAVAPIDEATVVEQTTAGPSTARTTPPVSGAAVVVTEPPSAEPATTTPPGPTSTAPPPSFVAPTTNGARIDSCVRHGNDRAVTYSWNFIGGTGWSPSASYVATGGGRYQATATVPRQQVTSFTSVSVIDPGGTAHSVALSPALSTNSC